MRDDTAHLTMSQPSKGRCPSFGLGIDSCLVLPPLLPSLRGPAGFCRTLFHFCLSSVLLGRRWLLLVVLVVGGPSVALAEPPSARDEVALFGGDDTDTAADRDTDAGADTDADTATVTAVERRDAAFFEESYEVDTSLATRRTLQLGGLLYQRSGLFLSEDKAFGDQGLVVDTLTDLYLDVQPNDRIRGFARGRLIYNPLAGGQGVGQATAAAGFSTGQREINTLLDQLWVKFDAARRVFFTVGRQHVRWGTTRLWNPVDVINIQRRNPLTLFDQRTGLSMIKVQVPIESLGWNVYAIAILEGAQGLDDIGGATRLEMVFGTAEIGLTAMARKDNDPATGYDIGGVDVRTGVDVSVGVGDVDLTSELGLRFGEGRPHMMFSLGAQYGFNITDQDALFLGVEGFWNPDGAADLETVRRGLFYTAFPEEDPDFELPRDPPQTFYVSRYYAALYLLAPSPGSWNDTTFTGSVVSNLTDRTGLARLDAAVQLHRGLSLELYGAAFFGNDGEFRFYSGVFGDLNDKLDANPGRREALESLGLTFQRVPRPVAQVGVNLRMTL